MSAFMWIFMTGFLGAHVGWYWLQQNYVPPEQRHNHPIVRYYLSHIKPKIKGD